MKYIWIGVIVAIVIIIVSLTVVLGIFTNEIQDIPGGSTIHVKGSDDAPVTMIEYSDFECPFCGRFWSQTLPDIEKDYIDTGKVKLIYKHFPLSFHPQAQPAAEASECASEQGRFWEYHDMVYANQDSMNRNSYIQWATDLGLDVTQFNSCFDSGKYRSKVQQNLIEGQQAGVQGTPAFFINGELVSGAQPYSVFQQVIDSKLGGG